MRVATTTHYGEGPMRRRINEPNPRSIDGRAAERRRMVRMEEEDRREAEYRANRLVRCDANGDGCGQLVPAKDLDDFGFCPECH